MCHPPKPQRVSVNRVFFFMKKLYKFLSILAVFIQRQKTFGDTQLMHTHTHTHTSESTRGQSTRYSAQITSHLPSMGELIFIFFFFGSNFSRAF